jgi:hypothetical protein
MLFRECPGEVELAFYATLRAPKYWFGIAGTRIVTRSLSTTVRHHLLLKSSSCERQNPVEVLPANPNAKKTTLPVIFAVKTWPGARKFAASIRPETNVRVKRARNKSFSESPVVILFSPSFQNLKPVQNDA